MMSKRDLADTHAELQRQAARADERAVRLARFERLTPVLGVVVGTVGSLTVGFTAGWVNALLYATLPFLVITAGSAAFAGWFRGESEYARGMAESARHRAGQLPPAGAGYGRRLLADLREQRAAAEHARQWRRRRGYSSSSSGSDDTVIIVPSVF